MTLTVPLPSVVMAAKLPKTTQVAPASTSAPATTAPATTAPATTSKPLVLAGPSGAGKSTLIKKLFADHKEVFGFSVSRKDVGGGGEMREGEGVTGEREREGGWGREGEGGRGGMGEGGRGGMGEGGRGGMEEGGREGEGDGGGRERGMEEGGRERGVEEGGRERGDGGGREGEGGWRREGWMHEGGRGLEKERRSFGLGHPFCSMKGGGKRQYNT